MHQRLIVTIGEGATRLIARVEYDSETDRLVGFVLPCDREGLPLTDAFISVSLQAIEEAFSVSCCSQVCICIYGTTTP